MIASAGRRRAVIEVMVVGSRGSARAPHRPARQSSTVRVAMVYSADTLRWPSSNAPKRKLFRVGEKGI